MWINVYIGDSSGGEIADNGDGVAIPPEGNPAPPLQAPYLAGEGDTVQMETTQYDGKHQLVGINYTIQTSDYTADQSQLVGSQSYHLIQSEAPATKHYSPIDHGSGIAVTVDGSLENVVCICIKSIHSLIHRILDCEWSSSRLHL